MNVDLLTMSSSAPGQPWICPISGPPRSAGLTSLSSRQRRRMMVEWAIYLVDRLREGAKVIAPPGGGA